MAYLTKDGSYTIFNETYQQHYHSRQGARFESDWLYVHHSNLAERLRQAQSLTVFDVGLGLGYNALSALEAWHNEARPSDLNIVSVEKDGDLFNRLKTGTADWQENWTDSWRHNVRNFVAKNPREFAAILPHSSGAKCIWTVAIIDPSQEFETLNPFRFDIIFHDPFSQAVNPELWSAEWFEKVRGIGNPGCVLLTYSVARAVRDHLVVAGWNIQKIKTPPQPGNGQKRHWLKAWI